MLRLACLSLLLVVPHNREPVCDRCEIVEVNSYYDGCGELVFVQLVFREPDRIVAWRIPKPLPVPQRIVGGWRLTWTDKDVIREVECRTVYATFTQYDAEAVERCWWPQEARRELTPVGRAKR